MQDRLPSVLAIPLADYRGERDALLQLWHMCDLAELALRTCAALALADWRRAGPLPERLAADVASRIEQPTLGKWRGMVLALCRRPPDGTPIPGLYRFVADALDPLLRADLAGATVSTSLMALRNRLAHGGGMSRAVAARLVIAHAGRLDECLAALDWLAEIQMWVPGAASGPGRMLGPEPRLVPGEPPALVAAAAPGDRPEAVLALAGDTVMDLSPLIVYGLPRSSDPSGPAPAVAVPQIYARRGEVQVLYTPVGSEEVALAEGSAAALAAVQALAERPPGPERWEVAGFEGELRREASRMVGRAAELDRLHELAAAPTGAVWITGPAGIGKSYLLARLSADLAGAGGEDRLLLPYRFKLGDARCSRDAFLRFSVERVARWSGSAPPGGPLVAQLRALLEGLPGGRRVLFVLDGIDEVAAADPAFAREIPVELSGAARFLCAGRPERALAAAFAEAEVAFAEGVPPLAADEVRAMLVEKIGALRKRLLARDQEQGEQVMNPFVERVVARAGGLPIYVAYVIGDVLSGRLRAFDEREPLPPSLDAYHGELLRRGSVGSLHQVLAPMVVALALAREALTPAALHALLVRRGLLSAGSPAAGEGVVERALAAAAPMLRRVPLAGGDGFTLFHLSLRDHLLDSAEAREVVITARAALADAACETDRDDAVRPYLLRHGLPHLVEAGRGDAAAALATSLHYLVTRTEILGTGAISGLVAEIAALADARPGEPELAVWSSFLQRRAHLLRRGGAAALVQAAIAESASSPVTRAAEAYVKARPPGQPWLRRLDRPAEVHATPLLRTLGGHRAAVTAAIVHPDRRRAVSAGADASLRIWDLETGACLRVLTESQRSQSLALVARVPRAEPMRDGYGHGWTVWAVAAHPDGRRVVAAHGDATLKVWDLDTGGCVATLRGHDGYVWSVVAAGDRFLSGGDDGSLRIWSLDGDGTEVGRLEGHDSWIGAIAVAGDRAYSAGGDRVVRAWDLTGGTARPALGGHSGWIRALAVCTESGRVVSGGGDGSIAVWDADGRGLARWEAHPDGVWSLAVLGDRISSGGRDGAVALWSFAGQRLATLAGHAGHISSLVPAGEARLLSASADKSLRLWDTSVRPGSAGRAGHDGPVLALALEPTGERALAAGADGTIRLWDLRGARSLRTIDGHRGEVRGLAWRPESDEAVSCGVDGTIRLWKPEAGAAIATLRAGGPQRALALSPDRRRLATAGADGRITLWDLGAGKTVATFEAHPGGVWALVADPGWTVLVSGGADGLIRIWDPDTGQSLGSLRGHTWDIEGLAIGPGGRRVLSVSRDRSAKLWDLRSGLCLRTLSGHAGAAVVALAGAGSRALTVRGDDTAELWRLDDGQVIARWPAEAPVTAAGAAGDRIVLGDAAGGLTYLALVESENSPGSIVDARSTRS